MKEYKVEMFQSGEWVGGHAPNYDGTIIHKDFRAALVDMNQIKLTWKNKELPYISKWFTLNAPTDFRVVSREVTEWTEEK